MKKYLWWYIPLFIIVLMVFVVPAFFVVINEIRVFVDRANWAAFILFVSPAAALYAGSLWGSIFVPLQILLAIPTLFAPENPDFNRRFLHTFGLLALLIVSVVIFQLFIWGCFPLPVDAQNNIHLRFIPFYPWPHTPLF